MPLIGAVANKTISQWRSIPQIMLLATALVIGNGLARRNISIMGDSAAALLLGLVAGIVCYYVDFSATYLAWIGFSKASCDKADVLRPAAVCWQPLARTLPADTSLESRHITDQCCPQYLTDVALWHPCRNSFSLHCCRRSFLRPATAWRLSREFLRLLLSVNHWGCMEPGITPRSLHEVLPDYPPPQLLQIREECGSYLRVCLRRHIHLDSTHRRHHVSLQSRIACNAMSTPLPAAGVHVCPCCPRRWLSGLLHLCFRFTFIESMLYGAIISATDPVRSPPNLHCSAPCASLQCQ